METQLRNPSVCGMKVIAFDHDLQHIHSYVQPKGHNGCRHCDLWNERAYLGSVLELVRCSI